MGPVGRPLADGRLHFQHGPIDLVLRAWGAGAEAAHRGAWARFQDILPVLCGELDGLRRPLAATPPDLKGPVARRMLAACWPHRAVYLTPMAAVAGSVADEMLAAMRAAAPDLARAFVNNGGDIALHVTGHETLTAGLVTDLAAPALDGEIVIRAGDGIGGIATSGWRGRSQSRGIADAVTVLARDAATADATATLIANDCDVDHQAVSRLPANVVKDDSDLGDLPVTVEVGALPADAVATALGRGARRAEQLRRDGHVVAASLALQGRFRIIGPLALPVARERAACR
jgi:ApbE superfamily uncharacterized protein (UPF0280 family)